MVEAANGTSSADVNTAIIEQEIVKNEKEKSTDEKTDAAMLHHTKEITDKVAKEIQVAQETDAADISSKEVTDISAKE